jgi:hypothetical protein
MKTATINQLERLKQDIYNVEVTEAALAQQKKVESVAVLIENVETKPLHKNSRRRWTNTERQVIH